MSNTVSLIGYRGTGKSTVGMRLARRLKWDWVDADNEVELRAGRSIKDIFATEGEPSFRKLEREVIVDLLGRDHLVLSTGGGAILNEETRRDLQAAGPVIWLNASVETIAARILGDSSTASRRPKLTATGGILEIRELMANREPFYRDCASIVVQTDGMAMADVVKTILAQLPANLIEEVRR